MTPEETRKLSAEARILEWLVNEKQRATEARIQAQRIRHETGYTDSSDLDATPAIDVDESEVE